MYKLAFANLEASFELKKLNSIGLGAKNETFITKGETKSYFEIHLLKSLNQIIVSIPPCIESSSD